MTIDGLLKDEPYIYDLMFDPQEMRWGDESEVKKLLVEDPYGVIYGLVQTIKEMEKELGWR